MTPSTAAVFFDLYGTLLDLEPLSAACERVAPGRGEAFARAWRAEQLRVTWLRTTMDRWADFETVTADALAWTARRMGVEADEVSGLADAFDKLPVRSEARPVLEDLHDAGLVLGVLSNGSRPMLERALRRAALQGAFAHVLSTDDARRYKPDPAVYALTRAATGRSAETIGFVTANDWDAAGAAAFGLRVAWLRPEGQVEPPPVGAPAPAIATWSELPALFRG